MYIRSDVHKRSRLGATHAIRCDRSPSGRIACSTLDRRAIVKKDSRCLDQRACHCCRRFCSTRLSSSMKWRRSCSLTSRRPRWLRPSDRTSRTQSEDGRAVVLAHVVVCVRAVYGREVPWRALLEHMVARDDRWSAQRLASVRSGLARRSLRNVPFVSAAGLHLAADQRTCALMINNLLPNRSVAAPTSFLVTRTLSFLIVPASAHLHTPAHCQTRWTCQAQPSR